MLQNCKNLIHFAKFLTKFNKISQIKRTLFTSVNYYAKDDDKIKNSNKVKLYPGYQDSHEEIQQSFNKDNTSVKNYFAKKVIEDFYGIDELEFEKEMPEEEKVDTYNEFNIDNAVKILNEENVQDIACIKLPEEINYADYMIIGNCLSDKHLNSVFISMNKKYKFLKEDSEAFLNKKSNKESKWCAIDTGKIVIHLFLPEFREFYDLECLWTCGNEYDEKYLEYKDEQKQIEQKLTLLEVNQDQKIH